MQKSIKSWNKSNWRKLPIKQQPIYQDKNKLKEVEEKLSKYPILVYFDEITKLQDHLKKVCKGEAFLLQGGDCAESFAEFTEENLTNYFKVILQMTVALMYGASKPVVKIGRIAGQFAKPRSSDFEVIDGNEIASYRGDMVNSIEADEELRIPNPNNLLEAYSQSAATLNFLRTLASGGFASLENVYEWIDDSTDLVKKNPQLKEIIKEIKQSSEFFNACGVDLKTSQDYNTADFFTSHEALLLNYEESLTRLNPLDKKYYNCSAHMLWIGDRTRSLDEAHIEYIRGIANPIAFKVSPTMKKKELVKILKTLNPNNEEGRITIISRMGADKIDDYLPDLIKEVKKSGQNVIWSCDPMHGNTETSSLGHKTRRFDNILKEVTKFFAIHRKLGTYAGGIHIEMTGQNVTECLGGAQEISETDLNSRYHTHCDPRLNASQSVELAFLISQELKKNRA
jgi:3-deoxy-7-phosphoheptulonate synthase